MSSRRVLVLLAATATSVAMLAMAGLAWAQQQPREDTTTATEDTTTATEDTTTAEQDATSTAAPSANKDDIKIEPKKPKPGSKTKDRTPLIKAKVTEDNNNDNNKLNKRDIKFYLDGDKEGDFTYRSGKGLLEFTPENNLSFDKHTVKVVAKGGQGQKEKETWSFRVVES